MCGACGEPLKRPRINSGNQPPGLLSIREVPLCRWRPQDAWPYLQGKSVVCPKRCCRCLARCFRGRHRPCPCSDSPSRHEAPDHQFNALRLQAPSAAQATSTISSLSRPRPDVIEAAYGHATAPAAVAFRPADRLGLTREDYGVCLKFASTIVQAQCRRGISAYVEARNLYGNTVIAAAMPWAFIIP